MTNHRPEHEDLVQRVLTGELAETHPDVRALLSECAECGDQLARLRRLDARLCTLAAQERDDLAQARAEASASEEQLVRSFVRRGAGRSASSAAGPARGPRRWLVVAFAASLLLLAWAATLFLAPDHGPGQEILLGGGAIECLAPRGQLTGDYGTFRWHFELPPQWSFELTLRRGEEGKGGEVLQRVSGLTDVHWTPSPETSRELPDEIHWEVTAHDETGNAPPVSGWAHATRPTRR